MKKVGFIFEKVLDFRSLLWYVVVLIILEHRPKALEALTSEEGALLRMNRSIQVEGVFGVLKEDYGFRRFLTRGKKNIETQFFLLAFALNIEKLCNRTK